MTQHLIPRHLNPPHMNHREATRPDPSPDRRGFIREFDELRGAAQAEAALYPDKSIEEILEQSGLSDRARAGGGADRPGQPVELFQLRRLLPDSLLADHGIILRGLRGDILSIGATAPMSPDIEKKICSILRAGGVDVRIEQDILEQSEAVALLRHPGKRSGVPGADLPGREPAIGTSAFGESAFGPGDSLAARITGFEKLLATESPSARRDRGADDRGALIQGAGLNELLDGILAESLSLRASDIHLQAGILTGTGQYERGCWVRYRIDGDLRFIHRVSSTLGERLIIAAKTRASLDVSDRLTATRGAFPYRWNGREMQVRVSFAPDGDGQKAVLRLLDLGTSYPFASYYRNAPAVLMAAPAILRRQQKRGSAVILAGPTSQGKSTGAYSMLGHADRAHRAIYTIGELIEHRLKYATQIEVSDVPGRRFEDISSQIVTLDPDIVHFEELNSPASAAAYLRIADTGHTVTTTLHEDRAADALARLLILMPGQDVPAACHIMAKTLDLVVNQRLVKQPCPFCAVSRLLPASVAELAEARGEDMDWLEQELVARLNHRAAAGQAAPQMAPVTGPAPDGSEIAGHQLTHHGPGCIQCNGTGYRGRTVLAEVLWPEDSPECRAALYDALRASEFHRIPELPGMRFESFTAAALRLVADGATDIFAVADFLRRGDLRYGPGFSAPDCLTPATGASHQPVPRSEAHISEAARSEAAL